MDSFSNKTVCIYTFQLNQISRRSLTTSMNKHSQFFQTAQASYQKETNNILYFRSKPPIESAKTISMESSFSKPLKFQRTSMKSNNFQEKLALKNGRNNFRSMQTSMDEESTELASMKSSSIIKSVKFIFENEKGNNLPTSKVINNEDRSSILKRKSQEKNVSEKSNGYSMNSYKKPIVNSLHLKGIKSEGIISQNDKYCQLYERLKLSKTKYSDQLFPPGSTTLSYSSNYRELFKDIKWVRLQEMFPYSMRAMLKGKPNEDHLQNIITPGVFKQFKYMVDCFNSLSGNRKSLQILFENQQLNKEGIYYVRIFHEGVWKYVIVDDYIPVMKKDNKPAFIDILQNHKIEVWPFLLQKAFAKLYSCYQFLIPIEKQNPYIVQFNTNFLQQMTGIVPKSILTSNNSFAMQLQSAFIDEDSIFLARKDDHWVSFIQDKPKRYQNFVSKSDKVKILDMDQIEDNNQQPVKIRWIMSTISNLQKQYDQIFICEVGKKFQYSVSVPIRQSSNVAYSLRKFSINIPLQCNFSLVQKDKRVFRKVNYEYSWARLIIVMKENRGTRWINGKYGTGKCIQLGNMWLQAGQYYCLIMVDWKTRPYDLILHFNGSQEVLFNRAQINEYPDIVPQLCVDIAQRFGLNAQINKSLCSYQYKDQLNGFIIQNIHNQSERQVFFYRRFGIPPDEQKYKIVGQSISAKNELEIQIKQDQQRTFILQCQDGINEKFFKNFIFSIRR